MVVQPLPYVSIVGRVKTQPELVSIVSPKEGSLPCFRKNMKYAHTFSWSSPWLEEPINRRCVKILFIDDLGVFPGMSDVP